MGIDVDQYRCAIGTFHSHQAGHQPLDQTIPQIQAGIRLQRTLQMRRGHGQLHPVPTEGPSDPVSAQVVENALMMAGVEPNPGPDEVHTVNK